MEDGKNAWDEWIVDEKEHWESGTVSRVADEGYTKSFSGPTIHDVPVSNIYPVTGGTLTATNSSYVLNSGWIGLAGDSPVGPQTGWVFAQNPPVSPVESKDLGTYGSVAEAQAAVDGDDGGSVKASIDARIQASIGGGGSVNYNFYNLHVTTSSESGGKPVVAKTTGSNTNMIPEDYINGLYVGAGSVSYSGLSSYSTKPNDVNIHTPVVNRASITWVKDFVNQKISTTNDRTYLQLDGQFTITFPNDGTHNAYQGYGARVYNSHQAVPRKATNWGKIKDIRMAFDTYIHYGSDQKFFLPANTWLSEANPPAGIDITGTSYTLTIPVWVTEQYYQIETRVIAENAHPELGHYEAKETGANYNQANYVAYQLIPVEIIGKIYDLRINATNDPDWKDVWSWKYSRDYVTANEFPFGQQGQNRVTQYPYAPKVGYTFVFNFKTKGRKSNNIDVSVQPEGFYFVGKNGTGLQEVDLYYNSTARKNIPILPGDTTGSIAVRLQDAFLEVPAQEMVDSNRIYPYPCEVSRAYNYGLSVSVGNFAKMHMPHSLRLCYNNFVEYVNALYGKGSTETSISTNAATGKSVNNGRDWVIGSVGHWFAGYRLPASTMVVPKGANIEDAVRRNDFLTDGYILVKMDIQTDYENGTGNYPYLDYMGPEALNSMGEETGKLDPNKEWTKDWRIDRETEPATLPNGTPTQVPKGTVAIFEAGVRSSNDLEVGGTH